ncbi:MAG: bifunctional glutamate N-acetyltransferase/amino-acid acetyltransferase ArgJ [Pseudomonadota bacterium]
MSAKQAGGPVSPLAPPSFPILPAVRGLQAAIGRLGLYKHARDDLMVVAFDKATSVGGAFTQSQTRSADVEWCKAALLRGAGLARALVCNAGNSNAFTGPAGVAKNKATTEAAAKLAGCAPENVFIAATGVIGQPLRPEMLAEALPAQWSALAAPDWEKLARAFMTTDTFPKGAGKTVEIGGKSVNIAGIAKGSGMIAPNMATMLAFVFTDAALAPSVTQALVSRHVDATFNSITVDGDTSTSDTLLLFATGASGAPPIERMSDPRLAPLSDAVRDVLMDLALQVVRDGEGATKLVRIEIAGAESEGAARRIGMAIANSPLVKTAIAGEDANWGRVVMAVGKAGEKIAVDRLAIRFGGQWSAKDGGWTAYDEPAVDAHMKGQEIDILVDVGVGKGAAVVWTCDLTKRYIEINGDYRS